MPTRSGRDYHFGEASVTMSSNPKTSSTSMNSNLLTILEDFKVQLNNLDQRMNMIENDCRNGDRQPNPCWEDRVPRNHDCHKDDRYIKNIKVDVSNFDGRLNSQYYLDWVMSLERYFKWYEMSQERRIRFAAMKLVGQAAYYWSNVERLMAIRR